MSLFKGFVLGEKQLQKALDNKTKEVSVEVQKALVDGILAIHSTAVKSIQSHVSKGNTYGNHTASKPGFPPNSDTGRLVQSIQYDFDLTEGVGFVGTNLEYGAFLEFGTSDMAPRPWLAPAFRKHEKKLRENIAKAVQNGLKK